MTSCPEIDAVEDMILGHLDVAQERELSAHLATCATCRAAREAFEAERALFLVRAPLVEAPEMRRARAVARGHASGALVALACAAAVVLAGNVAALRVETGGTAAPREPLASYSPSPANEPTLCDDDPSARGRELEPALSVERPVCEEVVTSAQVGQ